VPPRPKIDLANDPPWDMTRARDPSNRRHNARTVATGVLVFVVVVVIAASLASWATYRTPMWWSAPERLRWCGRDYARAPVHVDRSHIPEGSLPGDAPYPVHRVGSLPPVVGRPVIASVTPSARRHAISPPLPCAMVIYLRTSGSKYTPYVIQGGP
jgi:hypothetical protein